MDVAGDVDQGIERRLGRGQSRDLAGVGDVQRYGGQIRLGFELDQQRGVDVGRQDFGTLVRHRERARPSDPLGGGRDQHPLALQSSRHLLLPPLSLGAAPPLRPGRPC
jgi:hypothetical protein